MPTLRPLQLLSTPLKGGIYGIAGYYTDYDKSQHVIIASTSGSVYETHWSKKASTSNPVEIGKFVNINCLTGFFSSNDNHQHVVVATRDGKIQEITFVQPKKSSQRLLGTFSGIVGTHIGMPGFFSSGNDVFHIAVVDDKTKLHEITFNPQLKSAPTDFKDFPFFFGLNNITSITGFYASDDGTSHIIVALKDAHLKGHRVFDINYKTDQHSASATFLQQFDASPIIVAAFFDHITNTRHVIVRTSKHKVYDYSRSRHGEISTKELQFSSFSGKIVDMIAYCSTFDGNYHIIFATEDGYLYEISYP